LTVRVSQESKKMVNRSDDVWKKAGENLQDKGRERESTKKKGVGKKKRCFGGGEKMQRGTKGPNVFVKTKGGGKKLEQS